MFDFCLVFLGLFVYLLLRVVSVWMYEDFVGLAYVFCVFVG